MHTKLLRWGNSLGLRIPAPVARSLRIAAGDQLDLRLKGRALVIEPVRAALTLESLLAGETPEASPAPRPLVSWRPGRGDLVLFAKPRGSRTGDWAADGRCGESELTADHRQADHRQDHLLALVVSPAAYGTATGMAIGCLVADTETASPFDVALPTALPVKGVVAADQVIALDWRTEGLRSVCRAPDGVVDDVLKRLLTLVT
jgi:antitoxin component of MazEF toxin-antitoxin module/mRNA-degrading endonuclease toxin of MazEF toxin-antitoxin module